MQSKTNINILPLYDCFSYFISVHIRNNQLQISQFDCTLSNGKEAQFRKLHFNDLAIILFRGLDGHSGDFFLELRTVSKVLILCFYAFFLLKNTFIEEVQIRNRELV